MKLQLRLTYQFFLPFCVLALLSLSDDTFVKEGKVRISFGAYHSQGGYGAEDPISFESLPDTKVNAIPLSIKFSKGPWSLSAHTSYVEIRGNQSSLFINEELDLESELTKSSRSGFSDITVKGSYRLPRLNDQIYFRVGTKVKLPTSDPDNKLGSGEADYSFFTNATFRQSRNIINGQLGYQLSGDTADIDYNNRWFSRLSLQRLMSKRVLFGVSYYFKQAYRDDKDPIRKLNISGTWLQDKFKSYTLFGSAGLSDSSPDWALGLQWSYKFN